MAISPINDDSSPLSWIIFATIVVEEEERAIPIKNDSRSENLNSKLNKKTNNIDKKSWSSPPMTINFFKIKILLKFVSSPKVKSKKTIPK
jgi:hypothetical protein